jgi:hypothetical protein
VDNPTDANALDRCNAVVADFCEDLLTERWNPRQVASVKTMAVPILNGLDANAWKDKEGNQVPVEKWPNLLALALLRWKADPQPNGLKSHVRYVVKEQLGGPAPGSEAAAVAARGGEGSTEIAQKAGQDAGSTISKIRSQQERQADEAARIDAWIAANPEQYANLEAIATDEVQQTMTGLGKAAQSLAIRGKSRTKVREILEAQGDRGAA